jgi:hypothetical protein
MKNQPQSLNGQPRRLETRLPANKKCFGIFRREKGSARSLSALPPGSSIMAPQREFTFRKGGRCYGRQVSS